ncbi:thioredoxin domain-containing protein [Aureivirga sp. CE67]|uniref:thioredoxin domain-containing protein n=1 Tax=Aureivirga sp. CE67 TaxID=1788983 RepID=UPI0018C92FFC|nr:thioredoxin domain-containing protein [Aureivirga sp. CE67]
MSQKKHSNLLASETSPYLLQHAENPVFWKPWQDTHLQAADKENKLIIISIGYAACHWCHVMEKECFENKEVAEIMNRNFINIKVDREERPDVDQIYMQALQFMTGKGGWPLNIVALPDGRPIWGATFVSKENWIESLQQLIEVYKNSPERVYEYAEQLTEGIQEANLIDIKESSPEFSRKTLKKTVENWKKHMDFNLGGKKSAPKFPLPNNYQFLMRYAFQTEDKELMNYIETSLNHIAFGGIFDQIGGGFSRYSVDTKWHVPHFEKMLYDNGQLVSLYSEAFSLTKNSLYKEVIYETTKFIERELMNDEGAFYSSLDADSLNDENILEEGAFYVWKKEELKVLLGEESTLFEDYYNVNNYGLWEKEHFVLIRKESDESFSKKHSIPISDLKMKVQNWKSMLFHEREKRNKPRLDDKTLTSWNALMLKGYVDAHKVFQDEHFLEIAKKNANFILNKQLDENAKLFHNYKNGKSSINGYLEDYATVIDAFISLYEATFEEKWLLEAKKLTDYTFDHFYNSKNKMFYFTSDLDKDLISKKIEIEDNVIPSSNSMMANNLFKLGLFFSNAHYSEVSKQMLHNIQDQIETYGSGFSNWLILMCNFIGEFYEIAISGKDITEISTKFRKKYIPNIILAGNTKSSEIPLLKSRESIDTKVYICKNKNCNLPQTDFLKSINDINFKL